MKAKAVAAGLALFLLAAACVVFDVRPADTLRRAVRPTSDTAVVGDAKEIGGTATSPDPAPSGNHDDPQRVTTADVLGTASSNTTPIPRGRFNEPLASQLHVVAAAAASAPLWPRSVAQYEHPFGTCRGYRGLAAFNFSRWADFTLQRHFDLQRYVAERYAADPTAEAGPRDPLLEVDYNKTFMANGTRVWHRALPDGRLKFKTEHERCHRAVVEALAIFAAVMRRLRLPHWFITHGTLLGAARHGGMIPWDVDIDVALPRSQLTIVRKFWRREFPRGLFLQTERTERSFHMWIGKERGIRVKDRYSSYSGVSWSFMKRGKKMRQKPHHVGIHIDLIPMEKKFKGAMFKIFHDIFDKAEIFPLSAICFENMILPAPRNTTHFLNRLYGPDWMQPPSDAAFYRPLSHACLATVPGQSQWGLSHRSDFRDGQDPVLSPRDDPTGSFEEDVHRPYL